MKTLDWLKNYNLLIFDEIDSTNDEAKRLALAGVRGDFVIWANTQTKGRGKDLRPWISASGNLHASILLTPKENMPYSADFSLMVAVAVGEVLANLLPVDKKISYKWPNDILVEGKKISGILLESVMLGTQCKGLIIGVGINIAAAPLLTDNARYEATCLWHHLTSKIDASVVINDLMKSFEFFLNAYTNYGIGPIKEIWLQKCNDIGKKITIKIGEKEVSGIFSDMTKNGEIKLTLSNGEEVAISSGEVFCL
jgi:BirA family transcriptional regulator, biotin operon repressor / biotin---[acetyl-CoA-carboxylase] ligase